MVWCIFGSNKHVRAVKHHFRGRNRPNKYGLMNISLNYAQKAKYTWFGVYFAQIPMFEQ
jgi:hypothetical protein